MVTLLTVSTDSFKGSRRIRGSNPEVYRDLKESSPSLSFRPFAPFSSPRAIVNLIPPCLGEETGELLSFPLSHPSSPGFAACSCNQAASFATLPLRIGWCRALITSADVVPHTRTGFGASCASCSATASKSKLGFRGKRNGKVCALHFRISLCSTFSRTSVGPV